MDSSDELKLKLYRALLKKHSDLINKANKKTVGEIKNLVNPEDLTIQSLLEDFKPENYSFEKNYPDVAKKVFSFVQESISFVETNMDLSYWFSPKEILTNKVADDEDLAVFLCSLLAGLGDKNASVVIAELTDLSTHAFVITEFDDKFFLLDPALDEDFEKFSGSKENVLQNYSFKNNKIKHFLYRFNFKKYEQFV